MQEVQNKRENELIQLRKTVEAESKAHEAQIQEIRHKHTQQLEVANEQLDQLKKVLTEITSK